MASLLLLLGDLVSFFAKSSMRPNNKSYLSKQYHSQIISEINIQLLATQVQSNDKKDNGLAS